jgi:hypothetical protein
MLKSVAGIVLGYIVMAIFGFATLTGAYLGLGADRVFEPGSYVVSALWIALMIVITVISGFLGGLTCRAISKSRTTGLFFGAIVFVISFGFALPHIMKEQTPVTRSGEVPNLQAMAMGQTPSWLCIVNPVLAGLAAVMGSRVKKSQAA